MKVASSKRTSSRMRLKVFSEAAILRCNVRRDMPSRRTTKSKSWRPCAVAFTAMPSAPVTGLERLLPALSAILTARQIKPGHLQVGAVIAGLHHISEGQGVGARAAGIDRHLIVVELQGVLVTVTASLRAMVIVTRWPPLTVLAPLSVIADKEETAGVMSAPPPEADVPACS